MSLTGNLQKMSSQIDTATDQIQYHLPVGEHQFPLNDYVGKQLKLQFNGKINCIHCQRAIKKSYAQGYCYPCLKKLAICDRCLMSPELCHYDQGTCREPEWGLEHCFKPHIVYLANTSGLKVGITRLVNVPMRWIDQGAVQALPIFQVSNRLQSGLMETIFKNAVADATNWRVMLKGNNPHLDLESHRDVLYNRLETEINQLQQQYPDQIDHLPEAQSISLDYPVESYPSTIRSLNPDKTPQIGGQLMGIKGQYLIFEHGVINIRKYGGYQVEIED